MLVAEAAPEFLASAARPQLLRSSVQARFKPRVRSFPPFSRVAASTPLSHYVAILWGPPPDFSPACAP
eukprot:359247-Chlamydomonas_euryale.AAC.5